jgi:hypothetical protein
MMHRQYAVPGDMTTGTSHFFAVTQAERSLESSITQPLMEAFS